MVVLVASMVLAIKPAFAVEFVLKATSSVYFVLYFVTVTTHTKNGVDAHLTFK